ncbi:MAG: GNAT family N-acetyltransferase [Bdellovibrio sp.]|nr:GNAT family N-acetyltransferase [Bdellovibrio sp.]
MEKREFPATIQAHLVVLRKHQLEVAPTMFDYIEKDRERLRQFLPWVDFTKTLQDEINYLKMTHEKWAQFELFDYGIFDRDTDTYLGNVGVHSIAWNHERCELGYWILGDFEGKGFMSDAVRGLEKTCFEMGFNRVEIRCSSLNQRSASIPKRLGYRLEGVLSQDSIEMGRFRDTLIFGKTKSPVCPSQPA